MLWSKLFLFPIICCWAQSPISVRSSSRTVQQANVTQASATVPTPTPVSTVLHHAAVSVFSKHWPLSSAIRPSPTPVVASSPSASACGGVFNGISGEINVISTYYSGYCYWDIHSPLMNSSILLVVEHFQRQYCWNYYVATRNGRYRYFCGQKDPFAFLVSGSYVQVRLRSYYYYQMTLKTFYAVMNNDFLVSYQRDWNVTVGNISSTTVNVSWLPLNSSSLNSTDIYGYVTVCLRSGGSDILPLSVENASLASNTVVRNLKPYSNYKVKVVALLKDRVTGVITLKSSEKTDIRTKEDVPGYVPRVNGRNRGFDSLEIYWYPIPEEDTHGVLLGYIVYFRRYGSYENFTTVKVDSSTRVYIITGLLEATRYEIKVAGRTSVGEGPLRTTYESTGCGGTFNGTKGEINVTSSHYSGYCYWEIYSPLANSSILLVFQRFQIEYCWYGYVTTRNGQRRNICGQKEPFAILIAEGYARLQVYRHYYYFTALKALYFVMNNTGLDASYQRDWNVTVGNISSTTINVSWIPLNSSSLNSTDIYGYVAVCLRSGSSEILPLSVENASLALNTVVRNLKPYSNYKVKVVALLKDRVTGVTTLKGSEKTEIRTNEGVPGYVPWVNGHNLGSNSLEIYWSPIPEEDTHGVLLGYVVYFRRYFSNENFTIVKVNASTRVLRIRDLMEATRYEIKVAGRTSVGEGPLRTTYEYTGNCNAWLRISK